MPVPLTIGKLRGLQQCTSPRGTFTCLALDHRQNLRRAMNPADPSRVTDEQLSSFKLEVTAALADLGELAAHGELVALALPLDAKLGMGASLTATQAHAVHPGVIRSAAAGANAALPVVSDAAEPAAAPAFLAAVDEIPVVVVLPHETAAFATAAGPVVPLVARFATALATAAGPLVSKQARLSHGLVLLAQSHLGFSMTSGRCHPIIATRLWPGA